MAVDLQVVFPQEAIILNNVRVLPGPPAVIDVLGADFRSVEEVLINRIKSPDVVVLSKTRLVAQIPDPVLDHRVMSVSVLSRRLTLSTRSLLRFRIGNSPGKVTGIQRLIQKFLRVLLQTPGSDIFNPQLGGGALRNVGATFGVEEGEDIINNMIVAVDTTVRQLRAIQSRNPSIPLDERLSSARILRSGFNREDGAVDVVVEVNSMAGRSAVANLEV